ncbi:MAG: ABC transporter ATP-binding protein [Gammaproteobacteria bacterium]|mgnify:CR=1 FL=1|nr:ABC transporter ATP-binding protein [Gammaproteobacteria bacterium]
MIQAHSIDKSYQLSGRQVPVLKNISLTVAEGEFIAIMGPSGTGKSTLLNVLGCLDSADGGSYVLDQEAISEMDDRTLAEVRNRKLGFVFQSTSFVDYLDLPDNVAMPGFYSGMPRGQCRQHAIALLKQVGLEHRLTHLPGQLSGGESQRVAIARALFNQPRLLLADEPTGNLDSRNSADIVSLLKQLNSQGLTIVLITHDREVATAADRIYLMQDGVLDRQHND